MEWILLLVLVLGFIEIDNKLNKLIKKGNKKTLNREMIKSLVNKKVNLMIENENINNSYLFCSSSNIIGMIKEYDDVWINFEYQEKNKTINQYFRIADITSINEMDK